MRWRTSLCTSLFDRIAGLEAPERASAWIAAGRVLSAIAADVAQRPFFLVGLIAFVLLIPLAATSTSGMIRRLGGRRWQVLHRCVYAAAIGSVVHTYWPLRGVARYELILGFILIMRVWRAYARHNSAVKQPVVA